MYYSACIPAIFGRLPISQALANVHAAGLRHYEFWGWNPQQILEYLAAQTQYGLTPVAMCTTFHGLTDPNCRMKYLAGLEETIPMCSKLGCKTIISQVGAELAHLSREEQHESIVAGLRAAAPLLERSGITLVFEPLNTRIDHIGYYLWSADEAFQIVDEVGSPNVKTLIDLYHHYVMDDLDIAKIVSNIGKIGHFHMAGYPGRHEPLIDSEVDYPSILAAIRQAGYQGAVGLEYSPVHPAAEGLKELYPQLLTF